MLPYRPKLQMPSTSRDKALDALALLFLAILWVMTIVAYVKAPDIIAIHFKADGTPDGYGSKGTIFVEACVATFVYALLTIVNRYPHRMNYIVTITEENVRTQYTRAMNMLRWIRLGLLAFMIILFQLTLGSAKPDHPYVIVFFVAAIVIALPITIVLYSTKKHKKEA